VTRPVTPTKPCHSSDAATEGDIVRRYLSVPEAAEYLSTSVRFIRRLIAERRVAFHKVGKFVRFETADLDAFVAAGRVEPVDISDVWRSMRGAA
jgi:excisionase family DNA binding protein